MRFLSYPFFLLRVTHSAETVPLSEGSPIFPYWSSRVFLACSIIQAPWSTMSHVCITNRLNTFDFFFSCISTPLPLKTRDFIHLHSKCAQTHAHFAENAFYLCCNRILFLNKRIKTSCKPPHISERVVHTAKSACSSLNVFLAWHEQVERTPGDRSLVRISSARWMKSRAWLIWLRDAHFEPLCR